MGYYLQETFREEDGGYDFGHFNGPDEGYGNKVINCGKEHLTDRDLYLKFVFCVMGADYPPFAGKKVGLHRFSRFLHW